MSVGRQAIVPAIVLVVVLVLQTGAGAAPIQEAREVVGDFEFLLRTLSPRYERAQRVSIEYHITNVGDEAVSFSVSSPFGGFGTIVHRKGDPWRTEESEDGSIRRIPPEEHWANRHRSYYMPTLTQITLRPGETYRRGSSWPQTFEETEPGWALCLWRPDGSYLCPFEVVAPGTYVISAWVYAQWPYLPETPDVYYPMSIEIDVVPEPASSWMLLFLGCALLRRASGQRAASRTRV